MRSLASYVLRICPWKCCRRHSACFYIVNEQTATVCVCTRTSVWIICGVPVLFVVVNSVICQFALSPIGSSYLHRAAHDISIQGTTNNRHPHKPPVPLTPAKILCEPRPSPPRPGKQGACRLRPGVIWVCAISLNQSRPAFKCGRAPLNKYICQ